jgi:hypothetical protein
MRACWFDGPVADSVSQYYPCDACGEELRALFSPIQAFGEDETLCRLMFLARFVSLRSFHRVTS